MAAGFTHRIIIEGPTPGLRGLKASLARTVRRKTRRKAWVERVPFSFKAAYELTGMRGEVPPDPYELCGFPIRTVGPSLGELRYTFMTRDVEVKPIIARLSRVHPSLTFRLGSMVDGGDVSVYLVRRGRVRKRVVPDSVREQHYKRLEAELGQRLHEVDGHDGLLLATDYALFEEGMNIWNDVAPRTGSFEHQSWCGRRVRLMPDEWQHASDDLDDWFAAWNCDSVLDRAYRQTAFIATTGDGELVIRPRERHPEVDTLMTEADAKGWACITASNSYTSRLSDAENGARNDALRVGLTASGLRWLPGLSIDPDGQCSQEGVLVLGIKCDEAMEVGKRYAQTAIIVGRPGKYARLQYC